MSSIEFGLLLPAMPGRGTAREIYLKRIRENLDMVTGHFHSIWYVDHLQFQDEEILESWTALIYMAARYPSFHFGNMVLAQSFRNPALLAKMAATAQYLSEGRFILGIGTGWHKEEYDAYGFPYPAPGVRVEQLEEMLTILRALWTQPRATVEGKHYRVSNAVCEPKPDPLPRIMVGGEKPRMLQLIARHADEWNISQEDIAHSRDLVKACEKACVAVGRDPATLRRSWFGGCLCVPEGTDMSSVDQSHTYSPNALIGTPTQIREKLKPFIDLGVVSFQFKNEGFPDTTSLRLLVEEVLPRMHA